MLTMLSRQKNITRNVCGPAAGEGNNKKGGEITGGLHTHIRAIFLRGRRGFIYGFLRAGLAGEISRLHGKGFPGLEKKTFLQVLFSPSEIPPARLLLLHSLSLAGTEREKEEKGMNACGK